jgi:hypothetical protein
MCSMIREIATEEFLELWQVFVASLEDFPFPLEGTNVDRVGGMVVEQFWPPLPGSQQHAVGHR